MVLSPSHFFVSLSSFPPFRFIMLRLLYNADYFTLFFSGFSLLALCSFRAVPTTHFPLHAGLSFHDVVPFTLLLLSTFAFPVILYIYFVFFHLCCCLSSFRSSSPS